MDDYAVYVERVAKVLANHQAREAFALAGYWSCSCGFAFKNRVAGEHAKHVAQMIAKEVYGLGNPRTLADIDQLVEDYFLSPEWAFAQNTLVRIRKIIKGEDHKPKTCKHCGVGIVTGVGNGGWMHVNPFDRCSSFYYKECKPVVTVAEPSEGEDK